MGVRDDLRRVLAARKGEPDPPGAPAGPGVEVWHLRLTDETEDGLPVVELAVCRHDPTGTPDGCLVHPGEPVAEGRVLVCAPCSDGLPVVAP